MRDRKPREVSSELAPIRDEALNKNPLKKPLDEASTYPLDVWTLLNDWIKKGMSIQCCLCQQDESEWCAEFGEGGRER
jgi:hypothetical protein